MAESIKDTARGLLACVCAALEEAERPTCQCYATVGPPVIGGNCCECNIDDEGTKGTGETTISFERMYDADPNSLLQVSRLHPCGNNKTTVADFSIVVTRCYPTINENGEMPSPDECDEAADLMFGDLSDVWAALNCGCNTYRLIIQEMAVNSMPEFGCAVLGIRVSVEVTVRPTQVVGS